MKLNPQQAPLYGECLLTVQLCDEEVSEEEEDVEFYLLFSGSTQTHLSSTVRTSHVTLQAICPAHDCCESVRVTLCSARPGQPVGPLGEDRFRFVQDLAFDMAQFLVSAAGRRDGLEGTTLLDQCQIPLQECEQLDQGLARALRHLSLPQGWSVLGTDVGMGGDPAPQETLLHFAARRGLRRVAVFLLGQPGGPEARGLPNKQGATPASMAERRGHRRLQQLLSEEDGGWNAGADVPWQMRSGGRVVRHHPRLNTYTLTFGTRPDLPPPSLQREVDELRRLIGCHGQSPGGEHCLTQEMIPECCVSGDGVHALSRVQGSHARGKLLQETETGGSCLDRARPRSPIGGGQGAPPTACAGHEAAGDPPDGPPRVRGNGGERRRKVGPNRERGRNCEAREEKGAGPPAAWGPGGGEASTECSRGAQRSPVENRSSALTHTPPSSTAYCQKGESRSGREGEGEDCRVRGQTGDRAQPAPCGGPSATDMGLTQSQEHPETPNMREEPSESRRRTRGDVSPDEGGSGEGGRDGDTEDASFAAQQLSGPAPLENTGGHIEEGEASEGAPESAPPVTGEEELKSETNSSEQSKETAAGDGGAEKGETDSADVPCQTLDLVRPDPLAPAESASADEMTQTVAHTDNITSCPSADEDGGSCSRRGGACDVRAGIALATTRETTTQQEVDPMGEREAGKPSATDGTLLPTDSQCSSGGVSADSCVRSEEDRRENAVTSLSTELYPPLSSNQGTAETSKQQPSADPQCKGSEPKQGDLEASLGSEVTERDAGESDVHSDSHVEETVSHGEGDAQEHGSAVTSDPEVVSLNSGGWGTKSCPTAGDTVVLVNREPEDGPEPVDIEPTADQSTTISVAHRSSAAGEAENVATADQVDSQTGLPPGPGTEAGDDTEIHREKASFLLSDPFADSPQQEEQSPEPPAEIRESSPCPTHLSTGSSVWAARLDSGSDGDGFSGTETAEDGIFRKVEAEAMAGGGASDVSVSCPSSEDAAGVGPPGSAPVSSVRDGGRWSSGEGQHMGGGGVGEAEDEEKDQVTEVPGRPSLLRCPARSPSPFRRHSWSPGKTPEREAEVSQRSPSLGKRTPTFHRRSYSLEGLAMDGDGAKDRLQQRALLLEPLLSARPEREERGSMVSLTEEDLCSSRAERSSSLGRQISGVFRTTRRIHGSMTLPLTKSVSLLAINQRELDGMRSFSSVSGSLGYSISEEDPGALRAGAEGKSVTKVGRTFSYLRSKMSKKTKDKEKEKSKGKEKEKEREAKERDKRVLNGHLFSIVSSAPFIQCHQCHKPIDVKEASCCAHCNAHVHKACRETLPACTKIKMKLLKQQFAVPDSSTLRSKSLRERPWAVLTADEDGSRRHGGILPFSTTNLAKSISISNIAGPVLEEIPLKGLRYLSQSSDSLHKTSKVNESSESLTDEGTEMMDSQLMGEFEAEAKDLEADSWSFTVDRKFLKQLRKDVIKRQDVIYELIQTEMHHVRTLRIVAEVYTKGMLEERLPGRVLDRKRESRQENGDAGGFLVRNIGDVLVAQFSGSNAERMKKVYGRFCSRHKEALNFYKELHAKDKRFQAFIKKKMSSPVVRRLGIPECVLLVTQRITKYPVLLQRMLQNTKEGEEDHMAVTHALALVKEVISAVDSKVNDQEKKQRLMEAYRRTDSRSIMRMKSGQMFAREDLLRGGRLLHDGPLQLKTTAGRLKDVQALLLSDVFVFLQEKDQKYVFASLDQRSTVLSLQKLIVREVANEERGLFLITAGIEQPEMLEVHAGSKEERNAWIQLIREALSSMQKEEDEGIPSESEDAGDKRVLDSRAREMRDQLRKKDEQIAALLEEKLKVFRDMGDDGRVRSGALFRAGADDPPVGELLMKDALRVVETLQALVSGGLGGAVGQQVGGAVDPAGSAGSVWLPRRPQIFGNFDKNQMDISKHGGGDSPDLPRTESDGALKKGGNTNLLLLLRRDSEHVLHSTCRLHELLSTLQAVVVQQDTFLEEQRQALSERPSSSSSSSSWRSSSLVEQEKQRSLEKQRQEAASLQRQQAAHAEERRRREREWEARECELGGREARLVLLEEETHRGSDEVLREQQELRRWKEEYQRDLERLREAQRRLERDREQVGRELESMEQGMPAGEKSSGRAPRSAPEDSLHVQSPVESTRSSSPVKDSLIRMGSKRKGKTLNLFASNPCQKAAGGEGQSHIPGRLLQLAKAKEPKEKKEKKKKKGKGQPQAADSTLLPVSEQPGDGEILFC
ncbi:hypothetical protein AAFF_G00286560 [Aldrovandia affinis]|uniref:A-kinase anchor protein 13-like n=1 Tax=Aldrovandia affinis TaxID=143900 RepID=A0AAD7TAK8_9TELE|nr:hypothetical protein AAFF_G00286560 [Aldrovandia affinis]